MSKKSLTLKDFFKKVTLVESGEWLGWNFFLFSVISELRMIQWKQIGSNLNTGHISSSLGNIQLNVFFSQEM